MNQNQALIEGLLDGKLAVIPTDTLYGLVASAFKPEAVEKVYALRRRTPSKPCIILIANFTQLKGLGITPTKSQQATLEHHWPNPVSFILPTDSSDLEYLHRGTCSLAVRMPDDTELRELITLTGPLIAPSANHEGMPPAKSIAEAKAYFGDEVEFYIDKGVRKGEPSGLIDLTGRTPVILRPLRDK